MTFNWSKSYTFYNPSLIAIIVICLCVSCAPEYQEAVDKFNKNKILYLAKIEAHNNFGYRPQKGGDYYFFYVTVTYPLAYGKFKNDVISYNININKLEDLSNINGDDRVTEVENIRERVRKNIVIYVDSLNKALNDCKFIPIVYDQTFDPNNFEVYKQHIVLTEDDYVADSLNFSKRDSIFKKYITNDSDLNGFYKFEKVMAVFYSNIKKTK